MIRRRISETLIIEDGHVCCASCGHRLVATGQTWKPHARLRAVPLKSLPGAGMGLEDRVVIRQFSCPGCAALLDSETALPEDPFLVDIVAG